MSRILLCALSLLIGVQLMGCGNQTTLQGGGGTTETVGLIFTNDGNPASNVSIAFVPSDLNPQSGSEEIESAFSDTEGRFSVEGVTDGVYNILYKRDSQMALRHSIEIKDGAFVTAVSDTLKKTGSIRGVVTLLPEHSNLNIYLLLIGTNRFVSPIDEYGNFYIDSLAEGAYELTIVTKEANYGYIDTSFYIESGVQDTFADTLRIPYVGLQTPDSVSIIYDTLLQKTTVQWSAVESETVGGYQICRRAIDDTSDVTLFRVEATSFVDSCDGLFVLQNQDYSYDVATVDMDGRCGKPSDPQSMVYESHFRVCDSIKLGSLRERAFGGIISDGEGTLFAVCSDSALVYVLDEERHTLTHNLTIPDEVRPFDIVLMDDGSMMIAGDKGCYNLDRDGEMLWRYDIQTPMIDVVDTNMIYYADTSSKYSGINSIFSLDVITGEKDTVLFADEREVKSFSIEDGIIYIAFDFYGYLVVERSPLECYTPQLLYSGGHIRGACDIALGKNCITILTGKQLSQFNKKTMKKISHTILENGRYVTTGTSGIFSVLNDDGVLHKLKSKGK